MAGNVDDEVPDLAPQEPQLVDVEEKKVPLTLICGFLGAGKSTFLKYILTERHGYRIAVIVNEFSDTADIEAKTIGLSGNDGAPGELAEEYLELPNGCLCCSIKDRGIASIEQLMKKKGAFDYILLESTGIADPTTLAPMFWENSDWSDIFLDGVITVVDGVFGLQQLRGDASSESPGLSARQVACSDVILMNKTDIAKADDLRELESLIHRLNPAATIHPTTRGVVDLSRVLNLAAYSSRPHVLDVAHDEHHDHDSQHAHDDGQQHHLDGISSTIIPLPALTLEQHNKVESWLQHLLWEERYLSLSSPEPVSEGVPPLQVLRCKGIWGTTDGTPYVLQGVRNLYEITSDEYNRWDASAPGKLVLIGRGIEQAKADLEKSVSFAQPI
ncbi:CobW/HypB/UreG, nucleotide-binding domain-containing protein [Auriculariales sp. MPI-PUGE-AT-0066]|nr:CobW/HypB/UreG, nucleotide-binding domain-containing protein [Auriculariales sp. MPI-PUGE-AT-0066]